MGIFGRGNQPDGAAGFGVNLARRLKGQQTASGGRAQPRRRRGNRPDGMAGWGVDLGTRARGGRPEPRSGGCGCGGCGRSGLMMMGLTGLLASVLGMNKVAEPTTGSRAARVATRFVRSYQAHAAHRTVGACRYEPSCSDYALDAIAAHGAVRGTARAAARIARCTPGRGGYDPVR